MTDCEPTMRLRWLRREMPLNETWTKTENVLQQQWRRMIVGEVYPGVFDRYDYEWRDVETAEEHGTP